MISVIAASVEEGRPGFYQLALRSETAISASASEVSPLAELCPVDRLLVQPSAALEMRAEVQEMRTQTLNDLYKERPETKSEVQGAVGYAVFSNFGMNLFVVSTGRGEGVLRNNGNGKDTYMKMFSGGVGVGIGVKKYYAIFVYLSEDALNAFLSEGWSSETQADAAAKSEDDGGAVAASVAITSDIRLYQITDKGLAAQATIQGTKYSVDEELNNY